MRMRCTARAQIANRIKAKGLQKLRWYCQLCQKQCRDENGFKCHQMSDSHRRQMDLFGMNAGSVVDDFSKQFEESFLEHMRRRCVRGPRCIIITLTFTAEWCYNVAHRPA
jgi:hypothetical protein